MSTLLFILITSNANIEHVLSLPIPRRDTKEETVQWVNGPDTRGTFELTLSCVLTLLLCMWTSLHLNVPRQGETPLKQFTNKFLWTLLALFAPELVVFCAWEQWRSAKKLSKRMNEILRDKAKIDSPKHPWTMTHSFFAGMGGFVLEFDDGGTPFIEQYTGISRISLTARGVLLLAECGYIPDISKEAIVDKSKADGLAKTLVCVQAGWCLLQYVGRLASNLPVSLLELNTLGHALCAFAIYLSWWYKPLDIKEPHVLPVGFVPHSLIAYMWMSSGISRSILREDREMKDEFYDLTWIGVAERNEQKNVVDGVGVKLSAEDPLFGFAFHPYGGVFSSRERTEMVWAWPFVKKTTIPASQTVQLSAADVRRWKLASNAITHYETLGNVRPGDDLYRHRAGLLAARVGNWSNNSLVSSDDNFYTAFALAFISMAYGGLHASGWNHFFSTWQEQLIWRISSVMIAAVGAVVSLLLLWAKSEEWGMPLDIVPDFLKYIFEQLFDWIPELVVEIAIGIPAVLIPVAYCLCRVFLVVEAFIGLRELPAGVYITPSWSQLLPHL